MKKYPPFVNAYGKIPELFKEIKRASVPPKFTHDFVQTSLGLKSSSYRAMIPLLKRLGFLDQANIPTQAYRDYRDETQSGVILANKIKEAYFDLFVANEYAYKLSKKELSAKLKTVLGVSGDDKNLPVVVGTFTELVKLADFETKEKKPKEEPRKEEKETTSIQPGINQVEKKFGISYTINLNLPATTEIEVFNAIFKSLKENLLDDE